MSAVVLNRQQQLDQILNQLVVALRDRYPHITPEIVYDPPDRVDAWVRLHGAADADEWDEVRHFAHDVSDAASDQAGVLILMHTGEYRNAPQTLYTPTDQATVEAAIAAYKRRLNRE
jgi:hypothetical protein